MSVPVPERRHRRWWIIAAIVVAIAIVAATVAIVSANNRPTPATVTLVASATPGPNPFTESVASGTPATAIPAVAAKSAALRKTLPTDKDTHLMVAAGTLPGLYGGSEQESVCDPGKLVSFLSAHPDKAAAWAGVQGITAAGIGAFVATLTPVLLNSDTLVTNHGYFDGKADPFPSVLQAGTAVLVDAGGAPRAKCNCGNPLSAPELLDLATATTTGTPWPGYAPAQVTIVQASKATGTLTLVDIATGSTYPAGQGTGLWVAAAVDLTTPTPWTTTISTSTDGKEWAKVASIPGESVYELATGNGVWVAAASKPWDWGRVTPPTQLLVSSDLRSWHLVASLDDHVSGLTYGGGQWIAAGYPLSTGTGRLAWQSTDAREWIPAATTLGEGGPGGAHLNDLTYGDGRWISIVTEPGASAVSYAAEQPAPLMWTASSVDGLRWPGFAALPGKATTARLGFGGGKWLTVQNKFVPGSPGVPASNVSSVAVSSDGNSWVANPATGIGNSQFSAVAYGNGQWLATVTPARGNKSIEAFSATTFLSSSDATAWTAGAGLPLFVQALAFGPSPVATVPTAPAPTATAPSTAPGAVAAGGGNLVDGSYRLTVHEGATCIGMVDGVSLDRALLTVNGNRTTLETTGGFTFTGQFASRTTHDFTIVDTTTAQNSSSMGIGLMGLVAGDGTLSGQGTEAPRTADAPLDTCTFFFTGTLIGSPGQIVAPPSATVAAGGGTPSACDPATVLAVVNAGVPADQQKTLNPQDIRCTDSWITAGVNDPVHGSQNTVVLQRINGVWTLMDREAVCKSGAIPASLVQLGCYSN